MLMNVDVLEYIKNLYYVVPSSVYLGLLLILCTGIVLILSIRGLKKGRRLVFRYTLFIYVILILCSTVFFRTQNDYQDIKYFPFWSYKAIFEGREHMIVDNILNVVVFIPLGLLIGLGGSNIKWSKAVITGLGISVTIELIQFVWHRGFPEFDDIFHNVIGCTIGFGLYRLFNRLNKRNL